MRELKQEDPLELELGLELELQSEDVEAAEAAVAAASEGQLPCSCCDELLSNAEQLHCHQMERHSSSELSLALITLRGIDLPLMNGTYQTNGMPHEDDSSHLRHILLESANRSHDCDSESTVTVGSNARMPLISPPSSPMNSKMERIFESNLLPWSDNLNSLSISTCSYSPALDNSRDDDPLNLDNCGLWSEKKITKMNTSFSVGSKKAKKIYNDSDSRQFLCNVCDRRYKKKSHLERHVRNHTGVRPYACSMCDKRFAVRSILKQHIRVHTGERPFSCDICFQRFPQKSGLMTHMMLHNGKPFKCEYCIKSFVSNHKLMLHQKAHGDLLNGSPQEGPYCCSSCNMRFFTTGALADHAKAHIPQIPSSFVTTSCVSNEDDCISEDAARAAVSAVTRFQENTQNSLIDESQFKDGSIDFEETNATNFDNELLDIVKNEILIEEEEEYEENSNTEKHFYCESRWSGIGDMYIGGNCDNVC